MLSREQEKELVRYVGDVDRMDTETIKSELVDLYRSMMLREKYWLSQIKTAWRIEPFAALTSTPAPTFVSSPDLPDYLL